MEQRDKEMIARTGPVPLTVLLEFGRSRMSKFPCDEEVTSMKRITVVKTVLAALILMLALPQVSLGAEDDYIKWYGLGGELNGPMRWFGRIGINEYLGAEVIFAMEHISLDCEDGIGDCSSTSLDVGAGAIYELVPGAKIAPYLAGRFILTMRGNGDSETSGTVEAAGGVEYLLMQRLGVSGELNFSFRTDPTHVATGTRIRFYFYF
jgi:hypothetical protein